MGNSNSEDWITSFLSCFSENEEDAQKLIQNFKDIGNVIKTIEASDPDWRAFCSLAVFTSLLSTIRDVYSDPMQKELIDQAVKSMEDSYGRLKSAPDRDPADYNLSASLFFTRLALGFLYLARKEHNLTKHFLHETAVTKLSYRSGTCSWGPGRLDATRAIRLGKWLAAHVGAPRYAEESGDYQESILWIIEGAASSYSASVPTETINLCEKWAQQGIERTDADTCIHLLSSLGRLIDVAELADWEDKRPSEYPKTSVQYLAWKFGYLLAKMDESSDDLSYQLFEQAMEGTPDWAPGYVVASLSQWHWPKGDSDAFETLDSVLMNLWSRSGSYVPMEVEEGRRFATTGPDNGLYWAVRIGYADALREAPKKQPPLVLGTDKIETIISVTGIRKDILEFDGKINSIFQELQEAIYHITTTPDRIRKVLANSPALKDAYSQLPLTVVDILVRAEQYYQSGVGNAEARVEFAKAVEASWSHFFVKPLVAHIEEGKFKKIPIYLKPWPNRNPLGPTQLKGLSLSQWAQALAQANDSSNKELANAIKAIWQLDDSSNKLKDLSGALSEIMKYRGASAHYQDEEALSERELASLGKLRDLVLGKGRRSILAQIVETFHLSSNRIMRP